jgi:hypothetical protein
MIKHVLEMMFRTRFDDTMSDERVYFDALSLQLGIGCIYEGNGVTQKWISYVRDWCTTTGVRLIIVQKKLTTIETILPAIMSQMVLLNMIEIESSDIIDELTAYLISIYVRLFRQRRLLICA